MTFIESDTIELKSSVVADLCKEVAPPRGDYGSEGMCFGVAIASALKGSIAIWLSLGLLAGLVIGSRIPKNEDSNP